MALDAGSTPATPANSERHALNDPYDAEGVDRSLVRWMLRLTPTERLAYVQGLIDLSASARPVPNGDR